MSDTKVPFNDSLDDLFGLPLDPNADVSKPMIVFPASKQKAEYTENCTACRGSGSFYSSWGRYVGPCFKCKGKGKKTFKSSPETRAEAKERATKKKIKTQEENLTKFTAAYPEIAAWFETSHNFPFAVSLKESVVKYGSLTEKQIAAAEKAISALKAVKEARIEKQANAPTVDITKIVTALKTARDNGLKRPKITFDRVQFSLAPVTGKNPGAVYVKALGEYAGKIIDGKFQGVFKLDKELEDKILAIAADPLTKAVEHGRMTGNCAICNRELTTKESVARGIGPICAEKYGW